MSNFIPKSFKEYSKSMNLLSLRRYLLNPLFDEGFYLLRNKDVKVNAYGHYTKVGKVEGRCPHALFDPIYYQYKTQKVNGDPFKDYLKNQKGKIVSPHPLFDAEYYSNQLSEVPSNQTLLEHFLDLGWKDEISPTPHFDFDYYYRENPDVKSVGTNPFLHYLVFGEDEGRKPNEDFDPAKFAIPSKPPHWNAYAYESRGKLAFYAILKDKKAAYLNDASFMVRRTSDEKISLPNSLKKYQGSLEKFFDKDYYLQTNWDIRDSKYSPEEHYLSFGSKEGRCPHPLFDPAFYRKENFDTEEDAKDQEEPLFHYLAQSNELLVSPHPLFDAEYYLGQLKSLNISILSNETFLEHYLEKGWKEGISPSPHFDIDYYFSENPELKEAGFINPLIHYLTVGERAGLCPNDEFNPILIEKPFLDVNKNNPVYLNESKLGMAVKGQLGVSAQVMRFKRQLNQMDPTKPVVICVTHEATRTGAPAIILKLAEQLEQYLDMNVICLLGYGGDIEPDFRAVGPSYRFERWHPWANDGLPEEINMVLNVIAKYHPVGALVNSAECRNLLPYFNSKNIATVALIHEMGYVYPEGMFKVIAQNADYTIFPSQIVSDLANDNSKFPPNKIKVRGQGLLKPEILDIDRADAEVALRKFLELPEDAFIVMGCGSLTRRKGPQFFVNTAIHVLQRWRRENPGKELSSNKTEKVKDEKQGSKSSSKTKAKKKIKSGNKEIHFIWLGGKHPMVKEDFFWMERDIETAGISDNIHFLGTRPDSEKYFTGSDAFFMTSRADPFPCVIHEAMAAQLPIIGFKDAGGFSEALAEGSGVLVEYADTHAAGQYIWEWYENPQKKKEIGKRAKNRVINKYHYLDYTLEVASDLGEMARLILPDEKKANFSQYLGNISSLETEFRGGNISKKKETKKIIFTVPSWELSGVNTFIEKLIQELIKRGYDAYLLFTSNHILHFETPAELLPKVPYRFLGAESSDFKSIWHKLTKYLEAESPCVFVPNYDYIASAISSGLSDKVGILGVLHSDDTEHYEHTYRLGHYWNNIVSVSNTIEEKLLSYNPIFKEKSSVIYYGIDAPLKREMPKKRERFSIIYTGRIVQVQKRILDFIEIVEKLDKTGLDFVFTFIGDGPELDELKEGLEEFVIDNKVRLLGRQTVERVYEELEKAHVFALCSDFEGLPLSILEALSFHCVPVVTEIESGISEVLKHKENGLISPIGDIDAFVDNLLLVAKNKELRESMAHKAFETLSKYKLRQEDMADQYIKIFEEMFKEISKKEYKRPASLNTNTKNIILPPMLQKLPSGYTEDGSLY